MAIARKRNWPGARADENLGRYLEEISETPLLSQEEEIALTGRIKQGDEKALDRLVKANLRFVVSVAKQFQDQGMTLADLISEGNIGLMKAAKRFDESKGFKFISYGVWWIRQAIFKALAEQRGTISLSLYSVNQLYKLNRASRAFGQTEGREPASFELADSLGMSAASVTQLFNSQAVMSLDRPVDDELGSATPLDGTVAE